MTNGKNAFGFKKLIDKSWYNILYLPMGLTSGRGYQGSVPLCEGGDFYFSRFY